MELIWWSSLLSQAPAIPPVGEALGGWAGWITSIMSGGVLVWLLFWHLPAKDKQLSDIIAKKDEQYKEQAQGCEERINRLAEEFSKNTAQMRTDFKEALNIVVTHHSSDITTVTAAISKDLQNLHGEMKDVQIALRNGQRS